MNLNYLAIIGVAIAAYLIGSINFAVIFGKAFMKRDVRSIGSGNAGATNVLRSVGPLAGILTFLCDALKGFVAAFLGKTVFEAVNQGLGAEITAPIIGVYLCGALCMLGHVFPLFFGFKGGKGVATSVGIYAVCCPIAIICGLAVFAVVTAITRYVSLASVISALVVVVLSLLLPTTDICFWGQAVLSVAMGILVIAKHTENIKRLLKGEESKIGGKKHE